MFGSARKLKMLALGNGDCEGTAHPKSEGGECVECARGSAQYCKTENCRYLVHDVDENWEPGDPTCGLCASCAEWERKSDALGHLEHEVLNVIKEYSSWEVFSIELAHTGTKYIRADRDCEEKGCYQMVASLLIRVGDHSTAYCNEDISLVIPGEEGGDDHTIDCLRERLAGEYKGQAMEILCDECA